MTKADLIRQVASGTGQPAAIVEEVISSTMKAIKYGVQNGEEVTLRGFGTFAPKFRAEKPARNLNTGEKVIIPAHRVASFKPSREFVIN